MGDISHQDIADRLDALRTQHSKAYNAELERIRAETRSLQELCGSVGHVWARGQLTFGDRLSCAICNAAKP